MYENTNKVKALASIDWSQFGPISLVVIQPTSFCNLNCDYCYLSDRHLKTRLSLDLIDPIFKTLFTSRFLKDFFTICWHAGEPLTLPICFYESAFERIQKASLNYNTKEISFNHSFQTNGTLITQAWCDFFQQHSVHVGISLDGPAFIHDTHRQTRKGRGSHDLVMRGISYLHKNDIPFTVISVITKDSLDYPDEIFNFFIENGITDVGFNIEEIEGVNSTSSLEGEDIDALYLAFIQRLWELTTQNDGVLKLREFESLCHLIYTDSRLNNTEMNRPFAIVSIDYQGNFSTFDPELLSVKTERYGDFILGNVFDNTLESVCYTEKFARIYQDMVSGKELCHQTCPYFGVCGGGAGSNKFWENGTFNSTQTQACRYRIQVVTDVVLEGLESSLKLT